MVVVHGVLLNGLSTSSTIILHHRADRLDGTFGGYARRRWVLIYKPFGIVLGIVAGLVGKRIFDFVWTKVDDEEPPRRTTEETTWAQAAGRRGRRRA